MPPRVSAVLAVLVAIISVQAGASFSKSLFPMIGAEGTTALRQLFATVALVAIFRPWQQWPEARHGPAILAYGLSLGVMNLAFYLAIVKIPLGIAVAIEFGGPLTVAALASRRALDFLWIGCAGLGLVLLLPHFNRNAALDLVGCGWALLAGICWGLYILLSRHLAGHLPAGKTVALGMLVSIGLTLPIGLMHSGGLLWSWPVILAGIGVAILSSAIPYALEMRALRELPTRTFGLMMSLEPAVGALMGWVWLGERLVGTQWVAVGLVMLASLGSSLTSRQA